MMHHMRGKIETSLRFAGQVERYHTWPTIRKQNIAEHTWHMLRLYERIFGSLPAVVTQYIIYHDCGELRTGDLPFGAKILWPVLGNAARMAEGEALAALGVMLPNIGDALKRRVKICDLIEMWEFGQQELSMGNTYAQPIVSDTLDAIEEVRGKMDPEDNRKVADYITRKMGGVVCS
jgi:5'-deoxynucleotidase YfbR-like HD superfamily hydrolase